MSSLSALTGRSARIGILCALVAALVVPSGVAHANHPAGSNLEADPESSTLPTAPPDNRLRVTVSLECVPPLRRRNGRPRRAGAGQRRGRGRERPPRDGDTPDASPDIVSACTITGTDNPNTTGVNEETQCRFTFIGTNPGDDLIRVWFADANPDEAEPPLDPDSDETDVLVVTWFEPLPVGSRLNCNPETSKNPVTGANDDQSYICTLQTAAGGPLAWERIDGENLGGSNDPGPDAPNTADYDDFCTTNSKGQCRGTVLSLAEP